MWRRFSIPGVAQVLKQCTRRLQTGATLLLCQTHRLRTSASLLLNRTGGGRLFIAQFVSRPLQAYRDAIGRRLRA